MLLLKPHECKKTKAWIPAVTTSDTTDTSSMFARARFMDLEDGGSDTTTTSSISARVRFKDIDDGGGGGGGTRTASVLMGSFSSHS